jgi:hypothetical protein
MVHEELEKSREKTQKGTEMAKRVLSTAEWFRLLVTERS